MATVGEPNDERDALNFLEVLPAFVGQSTVTARCLSVIGREDNDRVVELTCVTQVVDGAADLSIDERRERVVVANGRCPVVPG